MTAHRSPVEIPPMVDSVSQMWHTLLDLGESLPSIWTLVGGQMVLLHTLERGVDPVRATQDGDVIADIRADPRAIARVVAALGRSGFELEAMSPVNNVGHRYVRELATPSRASGGPQRVVLDVLAPEGVGARADRETTRPARTVEVPAGTQALHRTELVPVLHEGRQGQVPRPSLLGALVAKSAACGLPGDIERHLGDVALLCALVEDPYDLLDSCDRKDRQRLRLSRALIDSRHLAWASLPEPLAERGQFAHALLTAT